MDAYQEIELDDYVRSGEGGTAVSYTHKTRNSLAKLYNPGFEAERARAEFLTARKGFAHEPISPNIVMKWTGHSDYEAMKPYIDIVDSIKAQSMTKFNNLL